MLSLCIIIITVLYVNAIRRDVSDRECSRIPVKKLKRLSQKSRKLRVFVWKRVLKVTPLSSKLNGYIGWRLINQIKRRRIIKGLRFAEKKKQQKSKLLFDENFVKQYL